MSVSPPWYPKYIRTLSKEFNQDSLLMMFTGEDQANGNGARLSEAVKHGTTHSKIEPIIFEIGMSLPTIYPLTFLR